MQDHADTPGVAMQVSRGVIVASIQVDLAEEVIERFRADLLDRIHTTGSRGVILDVSGLQTLDAEEFAALRRIIVMTGLMGAESVLMGLQPGVVSALIEAGVEVEGLKAAISLDAAFELLEPEIGADEETEAMDGEAEEPEDLTATREDVEPRLESDR